MKKQTKRNNKNKKNKKTRKNNKNIKGGAFIGKGTYGCAYNPPLPCKASQNPCLANPEDQRCQGISKLMNDKNAIEELTGLEILEKLNFDNETNTNYKYHLRNPFMCPYSESESSPINRVECDLTINQPTLLLYENGGQDLDKLFSTQLQTTHPSIVLKGLLNILEGIRELSRLGVVHCDIKEQNIVTGTDINPGFKLIDFGLLAAFDFNLVSSIEPKINFIGDYTKHPEESKFFDVIYVYFPIYAFFLNKKNPITDAELEARVDEYFINDIIKKYLGKYYKEKGINRDYFKKILIALNRIYNNEELKGKLQTQVAKSIDLFSFSIVLLQYASKLKETFTPKKCSPVTESIQSFINVNNFLHPMLDTIKIKTKTRPTFHSLIFYPGELPIDIEDYLFEDYDFDAIIKSFRSLLIDNFRINGMEI